MTDTTVWADWIAEGHFISVLSTVDAGARKYFFVKSREFSHYEYEWAQTIGALSFDGPRTINNLENTAKADTQIWQLIFGIDKQVYVYVHVPVDVDRHGVAKVPRQTAAFRTVGHYDGWMSPWMQPSWVTEHFLIRPDTPFIAVSCYNPQAITLTPRLNFFINKLDLEKLGEEKEGLLIASDFPQLQYNPRSGAIASRETGEVSKVTEEQLKKQSRWMETLELLYRRRIPHRPVTLMPVRAPATAT